MENLTVALKDDNLRDIFVRTFLESMTPEKAQAMIQSGLVELLSKDYQLKSVIEGLCLKYIKEEFDKNLNLKERLEKLVVEAIDKLLEPESKTRQEMINKMADSLAKGFTGRSY